MTPPHDVVVVPTILRAGPYRIYFYSGETNEPAHVHVDRNACTAKFWLDPVALARNRGFRRSEVVRIGKIIEGHDQELLRTWHEHFA